LKGFKRLVYSLNTKREEAIMKTAIVILHEIYGLNDFIRDLTEEWTNTFFLPVYTPIFTANKAAYLYSQESIAYTSFINHVGFDRAAKTVDSFFNEQKDYDTFLLLGFSIGATVGWRVSHRNRKVKGLVGFYGSRIRDYLTEKPTCPTLLIYPEHEKSFDVIKMSHEIASENHIFMHLVAASHGFADPYNPNYQKDISKQERHKAMKFLMNVNQIL
jgi:dienelactone hydrolase